MLVFFFFFASGFTRESCRASAAAATKKKMESQNCSGKIKFPVFFVSCHEFSKIQTKQEFFPKSPNLLGLNVNMGQKILIRSSFSSVEVRIDSQVQVDFSMMIQFSNATAYRHYTIIRSYIFEAIANAHSHSATVSLEGCILSLRVHPGHAIARTSSQCNISFELPLVFFCSPFAMHAHTIQRLSGRTTLSFTRFYLSFLCQYISTLMILCPTHLIYMYILHAAYMLSRCCRSL